MLKNSIKYYLLAIMVFCACSTTVVLQPNKYQKLNSLRSIGEYKVSRNIISNNKLELGQLLQSIPYKSKSDYVYTVYPEAKYKKTILNGYGDCSTMSFGAAYYLLNNNIPFELIHFLPVDSLFKGGGHVTIRVPYSYNGESRVGIVDLAGGGLPSYGGQYLDVYDLKQINIDFNFVRLNDKASEYYKNYYKYDYLKNVYFGFTPSSEISKYFKFINTYYIALGNEKLEKMVYDGLAIIVGKYYAIYVDQIIIEKYYYEIIFYKFILYIIRLFLLLFPLCLLIEAFNLIFRNKNISKYS